jgi:hypothetical protein
MKCPICGQRTLPGAKLCSPCRAALKRAKDDSVWELPPGHPPRPAGDRRSPPPPTGVEAAQPVGSPRAGQGSRLVGWRGVGVGLAALFVAAGVLATVRLVHVEGVEHVAVEPAPAPSPPAVPAVAPADPLPQVMTLPPAAADPPGHATPAVDDGHAPPRPAGGRAPRARVIAEPPPSPQPPPVEEPPLLPVQPPAVERPAPARPVDPWQRMAEGLARCAGQDLFARLGCEHRVRAAHCDGNWGRVPQCPAGIPNDHGQ